MLRKLLLLLLIGFAFTEINAQNTNIIAHIVECSNSEDAYYEFEEETNQNGRVAYRRLINIDTPTYGTPVWMGSTSGLTIDNSSANNTIKINWDGTQWVLRAGGSPLFINPATSMIPPDSGWVLDPASVCPGAPLSTVVMVDSGNGAALPVSRVEFTNIKIYPNPSTGFINISNLKETSHVRIFNIAGQIVKDVMVGANDSRIDIQDLAQGFYFVELEGKKTIKLLKR